MTSTDDLSHQAISSYFIGPEAENLDEFKANIAIILKEVERARKGYFLQPVDKKFIPDSIKTTATFKALTAKSRNAITHLSRLLGTHSIPSWSPRYQAHMCTDLSMVSLLGYFMGMLYNPNNVAIEASPFSSAAEILVGEQLCGLVGYNVTRGLGGDGGNGDGVVGWARVTSGGSVANLESIWVARNLKFYPLTLHLAITSGKLPFAKHNFTIRTCTGIEKNFTDLSTWELLNLRPETILDLPKMLTEQFGTSPAYIEKAIDEYNIQTTGKGKLEEAFGIRKDVRYLLGNTRHYSWPKGGAITGIGSQNFTGLKVDLEARLDLTDLVSKLESCLREQRAVYAVVAVIGSTEEGAVDRLSEILRIRARFQKKGLSFLVHADAAWGGYFATMLPRDIISQQMPTEHGHDPLKGVQASQEGFVPDMALKLETQEDLLALKYADSITIDPHKAGYIPYPAGSLLYRDERMKYLVTWTSPYIGRGSLTDLGAYGVEGSKPGAAAMSIWLANHCIGLHENGYGALLAEATFTCTRLAAHWTAMTTNSDPFISVSLNRLPSELNGGDIESEKQFIRDEILSKTNAQIQASSSQKHTMTLLRALGSDLNINAFALNWRYADGRVNDDIEEANYLMLRVVKEFSIESPDQRPGEKGLFLTSTMFRDGEYGECKEVFGDRLGLKRSREDLMVLRNVVMSPWPSEHGLIDDLMKRFRGVVEEAVEVCRDRNAIHPDIHRFFIQGTTEIYLIYRPRFKEARFRRQLILQVRFDKSSFEAYAKARTNGLVFLNTAKETGLEVLLSEVKNHGQACFLGDLVDGNGNKLSNTPITITILRILKNRSLSSLNREPTYPSTYTPFYLYGSTRQKHITHVLLKSPNIELSASNITLNLDSPLPEEELARGAILCLIDIPEEPMQPFPALSNTGTGTGTGSSGSISKSDSFFFRPTRTFKIKIYRDLKLASESGPNLLPLDIDDLGPEIVSGEMGLGREVLVDSIELNKDVFENEEKDEEWRGLFASVDDEEGGEVGAEKGIGKGEGQGNG